jgi:hypothetical protein
MTQALAQTGACRNCGAPAEQAYCPACGQETSLALPTVRTMLREAAGRYVALDGRAWRTMVPLLLRPGFLTREYFAGRRRRYIRPARLFLVASIALFAVLRFTGGLDALGDRKAREADPGARENSAHGGNVAPNPTLRLDLDTGPWLDPVRRRVEHFGRLPRSVMAEQIYSGMTRYGPYAALVLLPLFALLLKVIYLGRARRYPARPQRYAAHLVYAAHSHAFVFCAYVVYALVPVAVVRGGLVMWMLAYLPWSMKSVYGGRWSGVVVRTLVISAIYFLLFALTVAGLVVAVVLLG